MTSKICVDCKGPTSTIKSIRCQKCWFKHQEPTPEQRERSRQLAKKTGRRFKLKKYGLTPEDVEVLYMVQRGLCGICERFLTWGKDRICVDHDHKTGQVRLLLCSQCNTGLGLFKEDPNILKRAIKYLNI